MLHQLRQIVQERNGSCRLPDRIEGAESLKEARKHLMGLVRALFYRDGQEPTPGAAGRDAQIIGQLCRRIGPWATEEALYGAVLMRDSGKLVGLVGMREPMTTRVLLISRDNRQILGLARDAYHKAQDQEPVRRDILGSMVRPGVGRR